MSYRPLKNYYYEDAKLYEEEYKRRKENAVTIVFDFQIKGYDAFLMQLPELYELIINICKHNEKIEILCKNLPGIAIQQFADRCLIDEIVQTNNIEGVHSSKREIGNILNEVNINNKNKRFYGLVSRYCMLSSENNISIKTCSDIRSIYDELVSYEIKEDNPDNLPDGIIFRKDHVNVTTGTDKVIHHGVYPEKNIITSMDKAIAILNDPNINCMFSIAVFHYLFGYIHPFYDGNGRVSRFISSYLLSKKLHYLSGYRLSYTIKENISYYLKTFNLCNQNINRGDLTPFVKMFLEIIEKSMEQLESALTKRVSRLTIYKEKIDTNLNLSSKQDQMCFYLLQAALFSSDGISTSDLMDCLGISSSTTSKRLSFFKDSNLLKEKKIGHSKFYMLDLDTLNEIIK